ncbi:MAG TPA: glycosyltransferase [Saprospiraceae bacterium]|nr:glycosyltransferase [Saprospiraceae bacterium]
MIDEIRTVLGWLSLGIYSIAVFIVAVFGLLQVHLLIYYFLRKPKDGQASEDFDFPFVTVQLPVYNEMYVVERLIDQVAQLDYPLLEIQVLDDSTDETKEIIARKVKAYQAKGLDIKHIHRINRSGFKAGALEDALPMAKGEFIAIFDADFMPRPDFLRKLMPRFRDARVGVVQTRWEHLNETENILTRVQALLLNIHFIIEQVGRMNGHLFLQFNGTGGIWRKTTIVDAGGWRADTLTEDLDLSYRAQLKGWKIKYYSDVGAPAELPAEIFGLKSQQFRWMKGGAETAKLLLKPLWQSNQNLLVKVQGTAHLLTSSIFVAIVVATIFSVPASFLSFQVPKVMPLAVVSFLALIGLSMNYFIANLNRVRFRGNVWVRFIKLMLFYPLFLGLSLGMSLHNAYAVIKGYWGQASEFVRTPKFGEESASGRLRKKSYFSIQLDKIVLLEGVLAIYFAFGFWHSLSLGLYGFVFFHGVLAVGYGLVFFWAIRSKFLSGKD